LLERVKEVTGLSQMTTDGPSLLAAAAAADDDDTAFHSFIEVVDVIFGKKNETITKESSLRSLIIETTTRPPGQLAEF